jgi:hypothetical protein
MLLGLEGIVVDTVRRGDDGVGVVGVGTAIEFVGSCPQCGRRSSRSKGWVTTRPCDIKIGPDLPRIEWRKWLCLNDSCERKPFTESVPSVRPRARLTARAKQQMAHAVLDDKRSVARSPTPPSAPGTPATTRSSPPPTRSWTPAQAGHGVGYRRNLKGQSYFKLCPKALLVG